MIKSSELKKKYYNVHNHEFNHWAAEADLSKTTKERISENTKKAMQDPEVRKRYEEGLKKRKQSKGPRDPEIGRRISETKLRKAAEKRVALGLPPKEPTTKMGSPEYAKKMAKIVSDRWKDEDYKKRVGAEISKSLEGKQNRLGQTNSPTHRAAISAGLRRKLEEA